jgi:hypothetical protein
VKLSDIENRLVPWYMSSSKKDGPSIMLTSAPGRGKTSVLGLLPAKLAEAFPGKQFGNVVINGACLTLTTASGYLWPEEKNGKRYSEFTRPSWWTTAEGKPLEAYAGGVIVIDEIDKAGQDEKKIVGEAALSKRFASHQLPPGWVVWFAGNRASDRSGSTKDLDHLINRRLTIEVQDDIKSLTDWMERNGALPETVTFAHENPQIVFMAAPEKQGPWCTPRSLMQADGHVQSLMAAAKTDAIPTDPLAQEELAAGIGMGAAAQYTNTIRLGQELPTYEKIIASPSGAPVPKKPDATRLAAYKLASRVGATDMDKVLPYVQRLPTEFQMIFGRSAIQRDYKLVTNGAFKAWCGKHSALIAMLAKLK